MRRISAITSPRLAPTPACRDGAGRAVCHTQLRHCRQNLLVATDWSTATCSVSVECAQHAQIHCHRLLTDLRLRVSGKQLFQNPS